MSNEHVNEQRKAKQKLQSQFNETEMLKKFQGEPITNLQIKKIHQSMRVRIRCLYFDIKNQDMNV